MVQNKTKETVYSLFDKTDQWPLTKNKTWLNMAFLDQCAGSDEVFRAIRKSNKANLRDLIATTGLVILLKLD